MTSNDSVRYLFTKDGQCHGGSGSSVGELFRSLLPSLAWHVISNFPKSPSDFLKQRGIAGDESPTSHFNPSGHNDGSKKPKAMRSRDGMFIEDSVPGCTGLCLLRHIENRYHPHRLPGATTAGSGLLDAGITTESEWSTDGMLCRSLCRRRYVIGWERVVLSILLM
jgi:hypothetical protein